MSILYVCATPIGNLTDISLRAIDILKASDVILCEDTRLSKRLFEYHRINYNKIISLHEHNENEVTKKVIGYLQNGLVVTQVSDAGTPSISDPGSRLCDQVLSCGFNVSPIPGACAYTSLLSVSGVNSPSLFYGFLPSRSVSRCKVLKEWQNVSYAVCIYEAPHRILDCLKDIIVTLGSDCVLVMGRELTKQFETIKKTTASALLEFVQSDLNQQRGEFTLIVIPKQPADTEKLLSTEQIKVLELLICELPPKKAVSLTQKLVGGDKELLYGYAVRLKKC